VLVVAGAGAVVVAIARIPVRVVVVVVSRNSRNSPSVAAHHRSSSLANLTRCPTTTMAAVMGVGVGDLARCANSVIQLATSPLGAIAASTATSWGSAMMARALPARSLWQLMGKTSKVV
jgi:hypothetical protein